MFILTLYCQNKKGEGKKYLANYKRLVNDKWQIHKTK